MQSLFIKLNDIQNTLSDYYSTHKQTISFTDAVLHLYHIGRFSYSHKKMPDFSKWETPAQLASVFKELPLDATSIINKPTSFSSYVSEEYIGFSEKDIIPLLHVYHEAASTHMHNYFEINYVLEGSASLEVNYDTLSLSDGGLCIIAPHTPHKVTVAENSVALVFAIKKSTFKSAFFNTIDSENLLSAFFKNCLYSSTQKYLVFQVSPRPDLYDLIRHILSEAYSDLRYSNQICCSYMSIFFSMIIRCYSETYSSSQNKNTIVTQMPAILSYINSNYKTVTMDYLSSFFGYEKAYLGKQIRLASGLSFKEIITKLKLEEACNLLEYSSKKIEEIAESTGYNSPNHFCRTFHSVYGKSPMQYRKEHSVKLS